jgi:hypothetical protein
MVADDARGPVSDDIELARDALEKAQEARERGKVAHARRAALVVAVLAAALAIAENAAREAQTAYLADHIGASDIWSEYQAKSVRRAVFAQTADLLEALPNAADPTVAARAQKARAEAARMRSDVTTNGMEQLAARARATEQTRDREQHRGETLERAGGGLQLAIVLVTVSVVTETAALLFAGGGLGLLAVTYGVLAALSLI